MAVPADGDRMRKRADSARARASRVVTGLIVLTVGLLFLGDQMGVLHAENWFDYWPVILIAIGLSHLVGGSLIGGAIWLAIGGVFLMRNLGWTELGFRDLWAFWPLLISWVGGVLVFQSLTGDRRNRGNDSAQTFNAVAVMAGNRRTSSSSDFLGGDATAIMGGCEIDLRSATIAGSEAVIDVIAFWGGIEIRVPSDWTVEGRVTPVLGGYEDRSVAPAVPRQRLIIRGTAVMGGIEVRN